MCLCFAFRHEYPSICTFENVLSFPLAFSKILQKAEYIFIRNSNDAYICVYRLGRCCSNVRCITISRLIFPSATGSNKLYIIRSIGEEEAVKRPSKGLTI